MMSITDIQSQLVLLFADFFEKKNVVVPDHPLTWAHSSRLCSALCKEATSHGVMFFCFFGHSTAV